MSLIYEDSQLTFIPTDHRDRLHAGLNSSSPIQGRINRDDDESTNDELIFDIELDTD